MEDYRAPCYPFSEALTKLDLSPAELSYEIDRGSIEAVVYTPSRNLLLFRHDKNNQWIGFATCQYRGHLLVHKSFIQLLIDNQNSHLGKATARVLDIDGVTHLSTEYPFKYESMHAPFSEWKSFPPEELTRYISKLGAVPMPREQEHGMKIIQDLVHSFTGNKKKDPIKIHEGPDLVLNFQENSKFSKNDLRIPCSEISRFNRNKKINRPKPVAVDTKSGKRSSQALELIKRVFLENPSYSSNQLWNIIREDCDTDEPLYDTDYILINVDSECIEWKSTYGNEQSMKRGRFSNVISQLRKECNLSENSL